MAYACVVGGAKILRMSQKDHIKKAKEYVDVPIIGLIKQPYDDSEIFITPTMKEIDDLAEVGVDAIALDATLRKRPNGIELGKLINDAKSKYPDILFMADCATIEEVENANTLPFDIVSTTLCGYTKESEGLSNISNNYEFAKTAVSVSEKPLVIEGGV
ncbi:hypothetical protein Zmor_008698 [Zophobas morio]|uniref:N-acylglucosamine-6-phosphate 2-epimerase n=1 Tax=Zophobas morio TaxID=2755281 RepID=A0AA38M113_9CUCU|nr:hypothetical protein Zmor_008698 [Zophobas morio]